MTLAILNYDELLKAYDETIRLANRVLPESQANLQATMIMAIREYIDDITIAHVETKEFKKFEWLEHTKNEGSIL